MRLAKIPICLLSEKKFKALPDKRVLDYNLRKYAGGRKAGETFFEKAEEKLTIKCLLKWVAAGHLEEIKKVLKVNPRFAEAKDTFTDFCGLYLKISPLFN